MDEYAEKQGNPSVQIGLSTTYKAASGLGFTLSGNYFSSVHSGRLKLIDLPHARVFDVGAFWEAGRWHIKVDVTNVFDERYFRARTGDIFADMLIQAMPARRWLLTANYNF
jgi:outer membrane receptor protein involved in Fe transport